MEDSGVSRDPPVEDQPNAINADPDSHAQEKTSEKRPFSPEPNPVSPPPQDLASSPVKDSTFSPVLDSTSSPVTDAASSPKADPHAQETSEPEAPGGTNEPTGEQDTAELSENTLDKDLSKPASASTSASLDETPQTTESYLSEAVPDSPSAKRRRISLPGRSILKPLGQDEDTRDIDNQDAHDDTMTGTDIITSETLTETFSSTTEFVKRSRKSIGRRVSFAATARIRMFERDEKEDENPKTTSYLEGLIPKASFDTPFTPFTFGSEPNRNNSNDNNNNKDAGAVDSIVEPSADQTLDAYNEQNTTTDNESELNGSRRRSFEVNVYPSHSESTGSSSVTRTSHSMLDSSDGDSGKSPFDDDIDEGISSDDNDDSSLFSVSLRRTSQMDSDAVLGPRLPPGTLSRSTSADYGEQDSGLQEDSEDLSMLGMDFKDPGDSLILNFRKHRSSIPEPSTGPMLRGPFSTRGGSAMEEIHSDSRRSSLNNGPLSEHSGLVTDEDTDMDITSPIGAGIHAISRELPPASFKQDEEHTDIYTDGELTMDMTMPIGSGIVEANKSFTSTKNARLSLENHQSSSGAEASAADTQSIPSTNLEPGQNTVNYNGNKPSNTNNDMNGGGAATSATDIQPPSTPPRRVSLLLRTANSSSSTPRRGLDTPGRFTPTVRARFNIFPEVLERQLKNVESSSTGVGKWPFLSKIYHPSHVSPETSNLAKRIARYSTGASFSAPDRFQDKIAASQNRESMDIDPVFPSVELQSDVDSIFNESIALVGSQLSQSTQPTQPSQVSQPSQLSQSSQPSQPSQLSQPSQPSQLSQPLPPTRPHDVAENVAEEAEAVEDESITEDSFSEYPPITLEKFLSLIGASFLDNLSVSTRRRTIPHRPKDDKGSPYKMADFVKATLVPTAELNSYKEGCRIMKAFVDESRKTTLELEAKINQNNPECFRDFLEGDMATKEFIKDRFRMIKSHCKLDATDMWNTWRSELADFHQETLEHHLQKLKEDQLKIRKFAARLGDKAQVTARHAELKRQLEQSRERQSAFLQCDKDRLVNLAEAIEEQGTQLNQFWTILAKKKKEQADLLQKVGQLKITERNIQSKMAASQKTIEEHSYARPEDLERERMILAIVQATHRWEPFRSQSQASVFSRSPSGMLELVHDRILKVSIHTSKLGKESKAIELSLLDNENSNVSSLSMASRPKVLISSFEPKKLSQIKEYAALLEDFSTMIGPMYKVGTALNKILSDISQFWAKVTLIHRAIELVRAHHVVDLVVGSAENLKELEQGQQTKTLNGDDRSNGTRASKTSLVDGSTPIVLLDIRVRFTGPPAGRQRRSARLQRGGGHHSEHVMDMKNGHHQEMAEPVKFYLWFTFTLNDLLRFPAADAFTWRLEVVYGNISREKMAEVVTPCVKRGGYNVLSDICASVNQLLA
ncbi:hypothetical protein BGZ94_000067 [Podila epigama]|nr:hypothetical protein BGZ94_000067 [Podila epigama]